jgi:hypothetical protein
MASAGTSGATHVARRVVQGADRHQHGSCSLRGDASALIDLTGGQVAAAQLDTAVSQLFEYRKTANVRVRLG